MLYGAFGSDGTCFDAFDSFCCGLIALLHRCNSCRSRVVSEANIVAPPTHVPIG